MSSLALEAGISTCSCPARLAFLILVSISAIGSVTTASRQPYQLAFVTPGSKPREESARKQIRQSP